MVDPRETQAAPELDAAIAREIFGWKTHSPDYFDASKVLCSTGSGPRMLPAFSSDPSASAELRAKLWSMRFSEIQILIFIYKVAVRIFHRSYSTGWIEVEIKGDPRPAEFLAVARAGLIAARARKGAKC